MNEYLISPKAPLIFRDSKPFGAEDSLASSLPFPLPSTIAGALRTSYAEQQKPPIDYSDDKQIAKLRKKRVRGPILVEDTPDGLHLLLPTPADSLCILQDNKPTIKRLRPFSIEMGMGCDLPMGLHPVGPAQAIDSKPVTGAPSFWHYDKMVEWLSSNDSDNLDAKEQGCMALPRDLRTHVAIDNDKGTNQTGHLFQTEGLDFSSQQQMASRSTLNRKHGWNNQHYQFLTAFDGDPKQNYRTVGAERRLADICPIDPAKTLWPAACPAALTDQFKQTKGFRLVLATPALFDNGLFPSWLDATGAGQLDNLNVQLKAVANPRWIPATSWDLAREKREKRPAMNTLERAIPAGTVYWFEIIDGKPIELCERWLCPISDKRADDGFGLALVGIWNFT